AAKTSLLSVLGEVELDDLLAQREKLNARLQTIIDEHTEAWGIKVTQVQGTQVDLPQEMQRAIAAQAVHPGAHILPDDVETVEEQNPEKKTPTAAGKSIGLFITNRSARTASRR